VKSEPLSLTHSNRPIFVWGFLLPYFFLEETTTTSQDIMQISKVPLKWKFSNTTSSRSLSKSTSKSFPRKKRALAHALCASFRRCHCSERSRLLF